MGILGKVIGTGASLIGTGAAAIGKKIEDAFLKQEKKNLEYLSKYPYKYKYIVREVKEKTEDMKYAEEIGVEKDFFAIYTAENEPIYIAKRVTTSGKCRYVITDMDNKEIAGIKVATSFINSQKKNCSIELGDSSCEVSSNVVFSKRKFNISNDEYNMESNETGSEIKVYGKKNRKVMIQINKVPSDLGMKWGEYVIGCNDKQNELLMILLSVSVGIILMESANLLDTK